jgi:hypothetical protein
MQPCQERCRIVKLASQSTTVIAFQHSRVDLTSTNFRFETCAPLLLAVDAACSYTFLTRNNRQALKVSCDDMDPSEALQRLFFLSHPQHQID